MQELMNIVWSENLLPGRVFICLVGLASSLATLLALKHIRRYLVFEMGGLERLKSEIQRWQKEQRTSSQELVKLDELKKITLPLSLTRQRLHSIERMRTANVKVDLDALQQITFAAESSRLGLRLPGFAVSFILLLGLFGSIASLCLLLPGASQVEADTGATSGAMSAAFSSGMAGLLGSLWVSLMSLALTTAQARFFEKFERFTIEELLPQTVPDIRNEAWLRQMHYKIGDAFQRIKEIAEQNNQTFKEFETVAEGFSRLVDSLEESARKGLSADVQMLLGQMGQVIGQVSRSNDSVLNLVSNVPQALETTRTHNQNVLTRIDVLGQKNNEQHDKLTALLAATNEKFPQTLQALQQSNQAVMQRLETALSRTSDKTTTVMATPFPAQALKLLWYSIPLMFLLILVIVLAR
jgi:hypothetical protein